VRLIAVSVNDYRRSVFRLRLKGGAMFERYTEKARRVNSQQTAASLLYDCAARRTEYLIFFDKIVAALTG
jgi:hypothetical protein